MIDLSLIPAPDVLEALDYEALLAARKAELLDALPAEQRPAVAAVLALESEPLNKLMQVNAYRELLLRQRVNDAARAVMLAHATGADLDNLGVTPPYRVERLVITPADDTALPPVPAVLESDDDFRARILLSLEAYTTAGSTDSYRYHALTASGLVLDVSADSPAPGYVVVYILARPNGAHADGTAGEDLIATVQAALNRDTVRPLTDHVTVLSASIVTFQIEAHLIIDRGSDPAIVQAAAQQTVQQYAATIHRLGADPSISGIYRALHQPGVLRASLAEPAADIILSVGQAPYCTAITISAGYEP